MLTEYVVPEWGTGALWTDDGVVLAHDFRFGLPASARALGDANGGAAGEILAWLTAFLAGEDAPLARVPLDLAWCTPFQRAVADAVRAVPKGEVVSYGELAALAGHPNAARAAGTFCARNRFMFFLPCHRVVGADGIGGYGSAGVSVKRRLLALEGIEL